VAVFYFGSLNLWKLVIKREVNFENYFEDFHEWKLLKSSPASISGKFDYGKLNVMEFLSHFSC